MYQNFIIAKVLLQYGFSKVNLELNLGEFVVITGESGSGKSTLLNVISGLDSYEEGEMYIDGKETSHYTEKEFEDFRRKYVSNIFQNFNLVNSYTVYQNIELVLLLNGYRKSQVKEKVMNIIKEVDLLEFKKTKVSKLSGGQKQRVAIARALAKETPIIIADEPTGNLDSESAKSIMKLLNKISENKLVIVVTHNYEQVEQYAERKIKMHDGRIVEDKVVKRVEEKKENQGTKQNIEYKNITFFNKLRLGIRNTFNIAGKFSLLFMVFLFMTIAIMAEYSTFKKQEHLAEKQRMNYFYQDRNENRIVIKKQDKTNFTGEDYKTIEILDHVDYIVENDLLLDNQIALTDNQNLYLYGTAKNIDLYEGELDIGRMPETENEIVLIGYKNDYYLGNMAEELQKAEIYLQDDYTGMIDTSIKLKVVGIQYIKETIFYYTPLEMYVSSTFLDRLKLQVNKQRSQLEILFLDKYYDGMFHVVVNQNVPKGEAYVSSEFNYYSDTGSVNKKKITINVSNIYYKDSKEVTITKTYTKNTMKSLLGLTDYELNTNNIFINEEDYNYLYDKPSYQSSVFVKDVENIYETADALEDLGYKALVIKDTLIEQGLAQVMKILRTVVTLILIVTLTFICYFIINIILRSRNSYFTILRMLGANKSVLKLLLIIELLFIMNLVFVMFLGTILAVDSNILHIEFIKSIADYLKVADYALLYMVLVGMTYLISLKYAKKLFKDTAVKTFGEKV